MAPLASEAFWGGTFTYNAGVNVTDIDLTAPVDYATVPLLSSDLKTWMAKTLSAKQTSVTTKETAERKAMESDYAGCVKPVTLAWSGTSGNATRVVLKRTRDGKVVLDETTYGTSVEANNLEVGRNYTWTVTCGEQTKTGRFYTEATAPRIMNEGFSFIDNCRDLGGWATADGKVVKQGQVFRSAAFDWFGGHNADEGAWTIERRPVFSNYWNNAVGLKTQIDLRSASSIADAQDEYQYAGSCFGPGVRLFNPDAASGFSYTAYTFDDANNNKAFYSIVTNFADAAAYPILFHCAEGKDRTGTLAFVLAGVLGVPKATLETEYALTFYAKSDSRYKSEAWVTLIESRLTAAYPDASYPTVQAKCEAYLKAIGVTDAQLQAIRDNLLEDPEAKDEPDPDEPEPEVVLNCSELHEYLVTDATGYFVTAYVPHLKRTIVEMKVSIPKFGDNALFCANVYTAGGGTKGKNYQYGDYTQCYFTGDEDVSCEVQGFDGIYVPFASTYLNTPLTVRTADNWVEVLDVNGALVGRSVRGDVTGTDKRASGPLCLFDWTMGRESGGAIRHKYRAQKKVYSVKVWEVDAADAAVTNLVMDLVPARSKEGVKTLYDRVSDACLVPTSGGGFSFADNFVNPVSQKAYADLSVAVAAAKPGETVGVLAAPAVATEVVARPGVTIDCPFDTVTVKAPAEWFDVRQDGTAFSIALNAQATPEIAADGDKPAVEAKDGTFTVRLSNLKAGLYYTLLTAPSLDTPADEWTPVESYAPVKSEFTVDMTGAKGYYKAAVRDLP